MSHISPIPGYVNDTGASIPAEYIGEKIISTVLYANRVNIVNNVPTIILTLPITTRGYWEITGFIGATNIDNAYISCGYSTTGNLPGLQDRVQIRRTSSGTSSISSVALNGKLYNGLTTTTFNLVVLSGYSGGPLQCWGSLTAIRTL